MTNSPGNPPTNVTTAKAVAGLLLTGVGLTTGNVTLATTAAGLGINWLAASLPGLAGALFARRAEPPLVAAYRVALQQATAALRDEYRHTIDPHGDGLAFELIAATADRVAAAKFPDGVTTVERAQEALAAALAQLLHGHDQRQIAYLQTHLLARTADYFQAQLVQNDAAWRAFHGSILQTLATNSHRLLATVPRFSALLAAWSDADRTLAALQQTLERVDATTRATQAGVQRIEGKVEGLASQLDSQAQQATTRAVQQGSRTYIGSAHAERGGNATVTNTSNSNTSDVPASSSTATTLAPITILLLAANPVDTLPLRLDKEAREIKQALRLARHGDRFRLEQQWAVRTTDLLDALLHYRPQIVHFSGHGSADGRLYFENGEGNAVAISAAALDIMFAAVGGIRCVMLNACWSHRHARALTNSVETVVGMGHAVLDRAAITFVTGFYRTLGEGESVQKAHALGCAQLAAVSGMAQIKKKELPKLLTKTGVTADTVQFVNE